MYQVQLEHLVLRGPVEALHLVFGSRQQIAVVHLAVQLRLQPLHGGCGGVRGALGLQLPCAEPDQLLLERLVLVRDAPRLLLSLVPLVSHRLAVELERLGALLQDFNLLACARLVIVEPMHLIIVHFNVASEVRASAFVHTDFFSQLCCLHL